MNVPSIAIAVVEHEDQFLVGQRPADVPLAGYSEFPGGKIQAGESAEAAARRECQEETGIDVEVVGRYAEHVEEYGHGRVHLQFLACRPVGSTIPRAPFAWIPRKELAAQRFPSGNRSVVSMLVAGQAAIRLRPGRSGSGDVRQPF